MPLGIFLAAFESSSTLIDVSLQNWRTPIAAVSLAVVVLEAWSAEMWNRSAMHGPKTEIPEGPETLGAVDLLTLKHSIDVVFALRWKMMLMEMMDFSDPRMTHPKSARTRLRCSWPSWRSKDSVQPFDQSSFRRLRILATPLCG